MYMSRRLCCAIVVFTLLSLVVPLSPDDVRGSAVGTSGSVALLSSMKVNSVAVDADGARVIAACDEDGMAYSTDAGQTWSKTSGTFGVYSVAAVGAAAKRTLYWANGFYRAVLRSIDNGATEEIGNAEFPAEMQRAPWSGPATGILTCASDPNAIYVIADYGLYRTLDAGKTWAGVESPFNNKYAVISAAIDPSDSKHIIAGTDGTGLYQTFDGGATWSRPVDDSHGSRAFTTVAISPASSSTLFVMDWQQGQNLLVSDDMGLTWTAPSGWNQSSHTATNVAADPTAADTAYWANGTTVYRVSKNAEGQYEVQTVYAGLHNPAICVAAASSGTGERLWVGTTAGLEYVDLASTTIPGDVDGNGSVTMLDALLAARAAVGMTTLTGSAFQAADVNHDGTITMMDVLLIARIAVS